MAKKAKWKISRPTNTSFSLMIYCIVLIFLLLPYLPALCPMILILNILPHLVQPHFSIEFFKKWFSFPLVCFLNYLPQYIKKSILSKVSSVTPVHLLPWLPRFTEYLKPLIRVLTLTLTPVLLTWVSFSDIMLQLLLQLLHVCSFCIDSC